MSTAQWETREEEAEEPEGRRGRGSQGWVPVPSPDQLLVTQYLIFHEDSN